MCQANTAEFSRNLSRVRQRPTNGCSQGVNCRSLSPGRRQLWAPGLNGRRPSRDASERQSGAIGPDIEPGNGAITYRSTAVTPSDVTAILFTSP